jgi:hypothetical protein
MRVSGGVRPHESPASHVAVAGSISLGQHPSPLEVGSGGEECCPHPLTHHRGLAEVLLRLVVVAEETGEPTEVMVDGAFGAPATARKLSRAGCEPSHDGAGRFDVLVPRRR